MRTLFHSPSAGPTGRPGPLRTLASRTHQGRLKDPSRTHQGSIKALSRTHQGPFEGPSRAHQGRYKDPSKKLQGRLKEPSRELQGPFKGASRVLQGRLKDPSRSHQGSYKDPSRKLQGRFKWALLRWAQDRSLAGDASLTISGMPFLMSLNISIIPTIENFVINLSASLLIEVIFLESMFSKLRGTGDVGKSMYGKVSVPLATH